MMSSTIRARVGGSASRSSSPPPAWAQRGMMLESPVEEAVYGYWSNVDVDAFRATLPHKCDGLGARSEVPVTADLVMRDVDGDTGLATDPEGLPYGHEHVSHPRSACETSRARPLPRRHARGRSPPPSPRSFPAGRRVQSRVPGLRRPWHRTRAPSCGSALPASARDPRFRSPRSGSTRGRRTTPHWARFRRWPRSSRRTRSGPTESRRRSRPRRW